MDLCSVLYLSYDGVLEPLGESQIIGYLEPLAADYAITLVSFEKPADLGDRARFHAMSRRLNARNIAWLPLTYHKRPAVVSTAYDIVRAIIKCRRICRMRAVRIIHARSYVAALVALGARGASRAAFLFDMRGFWIDEKIEAGHWKKGGMLYRVGKWWERRFYEAADGVVSLTAAGARSIPELGVRVRSNVPIRVIPTCANLARFAPGPKDSDLLLDLDLDNSIVIGCVGTMGNWYLRSEMLRALALLTHRMERVKVLVVTRDDHEMLRADAMAAGLPQDRLVITRASFDEMPRHIRLFHAGLFFIKPSFSKRASAATKLAEFLGCGVPVVINDGVGDSASIVRDGRVGVVLPSPDERAMENALPDVRALISDPTVRDRCRKVAAEVFDIERGVESYRGLYRELLSSRLPK